MSVNHIKGRPIPIKFNDEQFEIINNEVLDLLSERQSVFQWAGTTYFK